MTEEPQKTEVEIHTRASEIWEAMYADCAEAKESIYFEQYILKDDSVGNKFLKLFVEKAKAGLDVRLMLDSIGSRDLYFSSVLKDFKEAGGVAYFYNPIGLDNLFLPSRWFPRTHIKTMLIDKKICYTGSACIWDEMAEWQDLQGRFTGELVNQVRKSFEQLWAQAEHKKIAGVSMNDGEYKGYNYVVTQLGVQPNHIYSRILGGIRDAKKEVRIVTPYFLPPLLLRRALRIALKRGISVMLMVSAESDVGIADYVSHSYYPKLLKYGVRIFHYSKTNLHAKYLVIDDDWATIGSTNMDYLSLLQNREANVFMTNKEAVAKVRADFDECMRDCQEIDFSYYRCLPYWKKLLGYAGRSIRRIL